MQLKGILNERAMASNRRKPVEAAAAICQKQSCNVQVPAIPSKWPWAWLGGGSTEADRQEFRGSCIFRVWRKLGHDWKYS